MKDSFGRKITTLRVSVTDRCNLRCRYCMGAEGIRLLPHEGILRFEEIADVVRAAVALGLTRVRLTGGEPLVRRGMVSLVRMLGRIEGIEDLAMTTNGTLLSPCAVELAAAGLQRVNVSLDALDPARYAEITRGGSVGDVLAGIEAAREAGLRPIKINCVVARSSDEPDARAVAEYGRRRGFIVRFIRWMDLPTGRFSVVEGGTGGDCPRCSRLRLTSDGRVRPCLFSDLSFSVRELGLAGALRRAIVHKPRTGTVAEYPMHAIGG